MPPVAEHEGQQTPPASLHGVNKAKPHGANMLVVVVLVLVVVLVVVTLGTRLCTHESTSAPREAAVSVQLPSPSAFAIAVVKFISAFSRHIASTVGASVRK